jgi:hypothetical protein
MAAPACHPCYPGSPSIGFGSCRQDRCSGLPHCRKGSTAPSYVSRLHIGSLTLRPAGLLSSLTEPLSGNSMLQVTPYTSLKLHGRTTELPWSDFNRQVIRFTRHTLLILRMDARKASNITSCTGVILILPHSHGSVNFFSDRIGMPAFRFQSPAGAAGK